jgi:hypothetical protein
MHISTRLLRSVAMLGIALAGSTALALSPPYAEDFESTGASQTGTWADNALVNTTNDWFSGVDDKSSITNMDYTIAGGIPFPISYDHESGNRVISLKTEGATLTNALTGATFSEGSPLYVDSMVNFVVSDEYPKAVSNDLNVKAAVFLDAASNLVVFCGSYVPAGPDFGPAKFVVTTNLVPGVWYRLTIALQAEDGDVPGQAFQVKINGNAVYSSEAYADTWNIDFPTTLPAGGSWFMSAVNRAGDDGVDPKDIKALAFQGTGFIDDIVVTASEPVFAAGSFSITQFIGAGGTANDVTSPISVASGGSTSLVYTANQWFRIAALTNDNSDVGAAVDQTTYTVTYTGVTASHDVKVYFKDATDVQAGITGINPLWADDFYATEAEAAGNVNLARDYMLDLVPTNSHSIGFAINSITLGGGGITNIVALKDWGAPLDTQIRGTLKLQGKVSMSDLSWNAILDAEFSNANFDTNGEFLIPFVADPTNVFFQAIITP